MPNCESTAQSFEAPENAPSTIALGIATHRRPRILLETLEHLRLQTRVPDKTIVAYVDSGDIANAAERYPEVHFIQAQAGICRQRNTIVEAALDSCLLIFIDDDFYLEPTYLEVTEAVFAANPAVVAATGTVLADGIHNAGLELAEAKAILAKFTRAASRQTPKPVFNAYGCNMSFRIAAIAANNIRFDERLPLYGWFEDVDFCRQLAPHGAIVKISNAYGVHLGAKTGRTSGVRLGYSQVSNPIYLARKRTLSWPNAITKVAKRLLKNLGRSLVPESYIDRRGRLRGNLLAFRELASGTLDPGRITDL
jgi:GT2 family glycosyltransferase